MTKAPDLLLPENAHLFEKLPPQEQLRLVCERKTDKENLLAGFKAETAAQARSIKKASDAVMKPLKTEIELLEARAESIIEAHRAEVMGGGKTLAIGGQCASFRRKPSVEIDDEEAALNELEEMARDNEATPFDRVTATACLRQGKSTLNREFMRELAKTEAAWLEGFGIRVVRPEELTIKILSAKEDSSES